MPRLRKHHKLVFSILIVCGIVAALLAIAQDQETLKIQSAYGADDRRFPAYVAALLGADATGGNQYQVLTNGDQIFPSMLGAISAASGMHWAAATERVSKRCFHGRTGSTATA